MKIRRKVSTGRRAPLPLFVIGFSTAPTSADLRAWFDLEYGGPLSLKPVPSDDASCSAALLATHGPWIVRLDLDLHSPDAENWQDRLQWSHRFCALVGRPPLSPESAIDSVLHAARLTRGLTLLSQGTAYDVDSDRYWNPSDWTDRDLDAFHIDDHVRIVQTEGESGRPWVFTRGMRKFNCDELEVFRPVGLPTHELPEQLLSIAAEVVRLGRSPNVGTTLRIPDLDRPVRVVRHRTVVMPTPIILREIDW